MHLLQVRFHVIGSSVLFRTQSDMSFMHQASDRNKVPSEVSLPPGTVYSQVSMHANIILTSLHIYII